MLLALRCGSYLGKADKKIPKVEDQAGSFPSETTAQKIKQINTRSSVIRHYSTYLTLQTGIRNL